MRGAVTCEQAYELVVQLLAFDPQPVLPADLVRLRQQLETVLPERQQTALTEAAADHWTSQRSLPAPSSRDCSPLPAYHGLLSRSGSCSSIWAAVIL